MTQIFLTLLLLLNITLGQTPINSYRSILVDNFENISGWEKVESEGTSINVYQDNGIKNKCIRIDFEFKLGSGYCGIRKKVNLHLPDNYQFVLYLKGESSPNNFEFKLIDSTGENVWWLNQRNFNFPQNWTQIKIKKRHITFAWGPKGGGQIDEVGYIEIIISSSTGGKGSIWIDELTIDELEPDSIRQEVSTFDFSASSGNSKFSFDKNPETFWEAKESSPYILIDFKSEKELGGFVIDFDRENYARKYEILISNDGKVWTSVYKIENGIGGRNYIYLNNCEARFFKIQLLNSPTGKFQIHEIAPQNVQFSASINDFFKNIASDYPYGYFPKHFRNKQVYWTVIGLPDDKKEVLVSETGAIEVDKLGFTLEPFVFVNNNLFTWADVKIYHQLEKGYLPIPSVIWLSNLFELEIKSFVSGYPDSSFIIVRYKIKNFLKSNLKGKLFIAIRPFQVLPPWQQLNITGGVSQIKNIFSDDSEIIINDDKRIIPLSKPDDFGFSEFDHGEIVNFICRGVLPEYRNVKDHFGYASGAIEYQFNLKGNEEKDFCLIIPLHNARNFNYTRFKGIKFENELEKVVNLWENLLNRVKIDIPDEKLLNTLKSNLAYILINADSPALQPGSRTYERSWIRDGTIIANSLLYFGLPDYVKRFLDWYSKYQYDNGKVPCVVDYRGPDPVPEHDSNGEFLYSISQYYKFTHDSIFILEKFNNIKDAVKYIEFLTSLRKTPEYQTGDKKAYYGLLTESISHEGYSAKPMHSYWDNFWALCGLESAEFVVGELLNKGFLKENEYLRYLKEMEFEFRKNLYRSIELAIKNKGIDFIPGCVELGDFDPTSTSIALIPTFALANPETPDTLKLFLLNTFWKYYEFFTSRKNSFQSNQLSNYTPYELRIINTFIYLERKDIAHEMLDFFIKHQRPFNWNMWAEVVWSYPEYPGFIGDMPHSWVGAEFINSFRNMFVFENFDSSLVVGAGINKRWILSGHKIAVEDMPTYFGKINFTMQLYKQEKVKEVFVNLSGDETLTQYVNSGRIPGLVIKNPLSEKPSYVIVNGSKLSTEDVRVKTLPAEVEFVY